MISWLSVSLILGVTAVDGSTLTTWVDGSGDWSTGVNWTGGVVPNNGNGAAKFDVMTYLARTGQFDSVNITGLLRGQSATLADEADPVSLTVHGTPIPEPATISLVGVGLALVRFDCRSTNKNMGLS